MNKHKHIKHMVFFTMCLIVLIQACKEPASSTNASNRGATPGICLADTIIYPTLIKNSDPNDKWTEQCLSRFDRELFVDKLFDAVYEHKARAYSYATNKEMSISEVKDIENQEDFSRDKVAKLQFWESWHFDEQQFIMTKKVHAVLIAYEYLSEDGDLLGYKAAFYVKMKE